MRSPLPRDAGAPATEAASRALAATLFTHLRDARDDRQRDACVVDVAGFLRRIETTGRSGVAVERRRHSLRATSGPVIRLRSGKVDAMIASDPRSPAKTVTQ